MNQIQKLDFYLVLFLILLFVGSCTKKKNQEPVIQPILKRLDVKLNSSIGGISIANSSSEVTVNSLRIPIRGIALEGSVGSIRSDIYNCPKTTNDECLVDLMNATALTDLLNSSQIIVKPGIYDTIAVYHCLTEGGFWSHVSSQITDPISNSTFYSHQSGVVNTVGPVEEMSIQSVGCIVRHAFVTPITVKNNDQFKLQLYFDPRNLVHMGFSSTDTGWSSQNCSGDNDFNNNADGPFLCLSQMDLVGTIDDDAPTVERYLINNLSIMGVLFDGSGNPLGGYMRKYFNSSLISGPNFQGESELKSINVNSDATLKISTFGSATDVTLPSLFSVESFLRLSVGESGTGTFIDETSVINSYSSVRLD